MDLNAYLEFDGCDWWLYRLPDGSAVRIAGDGPMRFSIDVEDGETLCGQSTEQAEALLRRLIGNRPTAV